MKIPRSAVSPNEDSAKARVHELGVKSSCTKARIQKLVYKARVQSPCKKLECKARVLKLVFKARAQKPVYKALVKSSFAKPVCKARVLV